MDLGFTDAYILWRRLPFPPLGSTPELRDLHADLGGAHEYVSVVDAFMRTGVFRRSAGDVPAELADVISRADALCAECTGSDLEAAREIRAYAVLLTILYERFLELGPSA